MKGNNNNNARPNRWKKKYLFFDEKLQVCKYILMDNLCKRTER